jgi:hypothetical protein
MAMDGKSPGLKTRATGNQWTAPSVPDTVNMQSEWSGREKKPRETHQRARKQIGLSKKAKGARIRAPSSKTPIHPVPKRLGHHHPGKVKNHFACTSANALPPIKNSYTKPQIVESTRVNQYHPNWRHTPA